DPVHAVVHALSDAIDLALDHERGELVGEHPQAPARRVAACARPVGGTERQDLRRSLALLPGTERAHAGAWLLVRDLEVDGPARALGGDDDPAADDRVLP